MAGLVPAIHAFDVAHVCKGVDARDERGHDDQTSRQTSEPYSFTAPVIDET